jgi:uncharacterized protein with PQ loop repeat
MRNIKQYKDFTNEEINWKKGLAGVTLGASLALTNPNIAKGQNLVNKIEAITKSKKSSDTILRNILDEIHSNINSKDSAKYIELFTDLSKHLSKEYGYEIKKTEVSSLSNEESKKLTLIEIIGWLGSICLAICGIPQAWMSFKDKHSHGISWAFILLWAFGEAFALAYVYDKLDLPLVVNYLTNILIVGVILYFKINPKSKPDENVKKRSH